MALSKWNFMVCKPAKTCRNSPTVFHYKFSAILTKLIIRSDGTHKKEMGPYKPQITNDDPSFHQVSFG